MSEISSGYPVNVLEDAKSRRYNTHISTGALARECKDEVLECIYISQYVRNDTEHLEKLSEVPKMTAARGVGQMDFGDIKRALMSEK